MRVYARNFNTRPAASSSQTVITVKIPAKMKKEMKKADINWSEYIGNAFKRKLISRK